MQLRRLLVIALLFSLTCMPLAAANWLHVRVETDDAEKVSVNVPLSLVTTVLPLLESHAPEELSRHGIRIDDQEISVAELREIWQELRSHGTYELATVNSDDTNVAVRIEGNYLRVETTGGSKERVNVKLPVAVVDALLSGEGNELNLMGALEALQAETDQELVTVDAEDAHVRVWIDGNNAG